ncbi:MAG: type IV pilus secretin PilQ [Deltaproteobacteria bacterium]|nr:type IV pilus secretin PilQ [Candidatus Tharpella sp.]
MNDINKVTRKKDMSVLLLMSVFLLTCLFFPLTNAGATESIVSLVATAQDDVVTLSFTCPTTKKIDYKIFTLETPPRLVIDFPKASFIKNNVNEIIKKSGYTRLRSFDSEDKTRIVIDTNYATLPPFTQRAINQELLVTLKKAAPGSKKSNIQEKSRKSTPFKQNNNPITIDFKGTDIQNVFRFLAEINNLNVVMSDDVSGTVTLRLKKVPWRQVLSIVLKTHQLGMEKEGNVVRIAPLTVFAEEERVLEDKRRAEAERKKTDEDIQATVLKILKVNFADINDVASKIENAILSDRGSVETDPRTNSLIIRDIPDRISQAEGLLRELDEPVKQVMIEAKIVKIERRSASELGIQWGGAWGKTTNDRYYGITGNNDLGSTGAPPVNPGPGTAINSNYAVNLPSIAASSGIGLIFGKIDKYNLSLKLSAMQGRGNARILSSPKILALNGHQARIGQGQEIPYQTTSGNDGTTTEFKKAELSLEVTPTITNNSMVSMEVIVSKDSKGENTTDGPAINTQTITTSLLLNDGETAVVGGIIESNKSKDNQSVPIVGNIPLLGWLFKHDIHSSDETELMIFITPRIIK